MRPLLLAMLAMTLPLTLSATLITVDDGGTGDYDDIQEAIDASADGDTVLVFPGVYYGHVDYTGKAISVMSLAITTGDTSYVAQTVLDGQWVTGVVRIDGCYGAFLGGFTIQHGIGQHMAIYNCYVGAGVYIDDSIVTLQDCRIHDNYSHGGGGGGVKIINSHCNLSGTTITRNMAGGSGGGLGFTWNPSSNPPLQTEVTFDSLNKNSIYCNSGLRGNDISISRCENLDIALDRFTDSVPDPYFVYLMESSITTFSVDEAVVEPAEADLYVSATGSDANGGLSPDDPLQNVAFAMMKIRADSLHLRTVHVADGFYSHSATGELLPVHLRKNVSLIGDGDTQFDGEGMFPFFLHYEEVGDDLHIRSGSITVENFLLTHGVPYSLAPPLYLRNLDYATMRNIVVEDVVLPGLEGGRPALVSSQTCDHYVMSNITTGEYEYSAGMNVGYFLTAELDRLRIADAKSGLGIHYTHPITPSFATVTNSLITGCENLEPWPGAIRTSGLKIYGAYYTVDPDSMGAKIINCTIADNAALHAAVLVQDRVSAEFYNTVIYGNEPNVIALDGRYNPGSAFFSHCLLEGGIDAIDPYGTLYEWDTEYIITGNPLFSGEGEHPYELTAWSPCLNAGTTDIPGFSFAPDAVDLAGNPRIHGTGIDLGAYEFQGVSIDDEADEKPLRIRVYPNPVSLAKRQDNFYCTFALSMPVSTEIEISLYNIRGQKVRTLVSGYLGGGQHEMRWNGCDDNGKLVGSGVYLYRITTSQGQRNGRITIVK
ncbi:MAG: T9SS type A sorting domain-containing protein [Candidatus Cloacimonetes bacterium]|nr:T9SS type A sorting domain-containing protein [Candidatus Cloacimonadota bacterium]